MKFGVDYYPEHWPQERWITDARMMAQAHINVVRLGEFAWAKMEPEEGRYDFAWLDQIIEVMAEENIQIVLGTPSAAAPKWLMDKNPECYPENSFGIKKAFGGRRHYCYSNETYRRYAVTIAEKMAQRYGKNPHIAAWQIDNEMGGICYCDSCQRGFRKWLKRKYHSIGKVNEVWGTVFWSQTYQDFCEIDPPRYNACDGFHEGYPAGNAAPGTPWSHNPGLLLDFVSWDNYVDSMWGKEKWQHTAMAHDIIRGIKNRKFWVMEQQSGPCGWQTLGDTPEPGQLRLWTYQAIAHGAEAILYFRWRACLFGTEQNWYGILDHDGRAGRRYREIQRIGEEIGRISEHLTAAKEESQVLLVRDYDNLWSHRGQPHNAGFNYDRLLQQYYEALSALQINMDVSGIEKDWNAYKLVVMPAFGLVTQEIADKCRRYVETGGSLLLTFRSGTREWTNRMTDRILPGWFRELSGVTVEEFDSLNFGRQVQVEGSFGKGTASIWCDVLQVSTADVKAVYGDHFYARHPAVTVNTWGEGKVYYVGCDLDSVGMASLMKEIVGECGLNIGYMVNAKDLEVVVKESSACRYIYLLNHSKELIEVMPEQSYKELLTEHTEEGKQILEPFGVKIWMEEKADRTIPWPSE